MNTPILGQEAICPDGLGRVVAFSLDSTGGWIQVATYVNNRSCKWDIINVKIVPIGNLIDLTLRNANTKLQPIETAPRDGTYIILFVSTEYTSHPHCEVGHWDHKYQSTNPWRSHHNDAFTEGRYQPTHWMPLPQNLGDLF